MHLSRKLIMCAGAGAFVALVLFGLITRQQSSALLPALAPLPQDPQIQVYFNQSQAQVYTDPDRQIERWGDDLEAVILTAIAEAETSIDVAVQELRLPRIVQALRDRQAAGIRVRVILENDYTQALSQLTPAEVAQLDEHDRPKYEDFYQRADTNQDGQVSPAEGLSHDAIGLLMASGVPWLDDTADGSRGSDLMHHKFIVIDGRQVLMGSANFTPSDVHGDFGQPASRGNANSLVVIQSPELAAIYTQEFNLMWGDGPGRQPDSQFGLQKPYRSPQMVKLGEDSAIAVQFSPTTSRQPWENSVNGLIGRSLAQAQSSTDMALFVFTDQNLSNVLQTSHQRGVNVRALIDPGFAYRYYSEGLDMMGVALPENADKCYEEENQPWSRPLDTVGIANLPEGDKLHHKFGLIDQRLVIVGSHNWSNAANEGNDENLIVMQNPTVAAHYQREFDRLYATSSLGVPPWLRTKIQTEAIPCQN